MEGDFEPEGWSAFDDHGGGEGNAGCGCLFLVLGALAVLMAIANR